MLVKEEYFREFFVTYYSEMSLRNGLKFLSPIWIYFGVNNDWSRGESILLSIVIAVAVTAAMIAFALFLYLRDHPRQQEKQSLSQNQSR
jgi:phosphate/sulfate permease